VWRLSFLAILKLHFLVKLPFKVFSFFLEFKAFGKLPKIIQEFDNSTKGTPSQG